MDRVRDLLQLVSARRFSRAEEVVECELCGDADSNYVIGFLRDGRMACWHCAERQGEFCILEAGLKEWRGLHQLWCVICRERSEVLN